LEFVNKPRIIPAEATYNLYSFMQRNDIVCLQKKEAEGIQLLTSLVVVFSGAFCQSLIVDLTSLTPVFCLAGDHNIRLLQICRDAAAEQSKDTDELFFPMFDRLNRV